MNFNLEYVDAEYSPDSGLPLVDNRIPGVPRTRDYQTPFDFSNQTINRAQIDYEVDLGERLTLRNKLYHRDLDWQSSGTQFLGAIPVFDDYRIVRTVTTLDDRQKYTGNQFEAIFKLGSGSVTHSLLTGLELAIRTDDFDIGNIAPHGATMFPGIPTISLLNPVETAVETPALPFLNGDSESRIVSPYVVDQIRFSRQFHLMLGARLDVISRDDARTFFGVLPDDVSRDDSEVSPMAGFVYAPTQALSLYANAGGSYAPASPRLIGELEPEDSTAYEIGVKKSFLGETVRTTFAVYQIDRANIPIPDANGVTQQAGDQRSRGFEIELAAEPLPRLRTFLSYAYNDSELTRFSQTPGPAPPGTPGVDLSGNTPPFAPENLLNLWISRSFNRGLGVGGGVRFIDDQFIDADNVFEIDSAVVLDATVFYDLKQLRLRLNFKNLTDEEYELRGFGPFSVIPADEPARSISASTTGSEMRRRKRTAGRRSRRAAVRRRATTGR